MKLLELLNGGPELTIGERLRNRLNESGDDGVHLTKAEALVLASMLNEHYGEDPFIREPFLTADHLKAMGLEVADLDLAKNAAHGADAPPSEQPRSEDIPREVEQAQNNLDQDHQISDEDKRAAALLVGAAASSGWKSDEQEDHVGSRDKLADGLPSNSETRAVAESAFLALNKSRANRYKNQPVRGRSADSIVGIQG